MAVFKKIIIWLVVIGILFGLGYGGYRYWMKRQENMAMMMGGDPMGGMGSGPLPLPVGACTIMNVTDAMEFTGTTEAVSDIEIRARVEGFLKGIHFTDGALVEAGQLLFTIEPETYKARRDEAAAMLRAAQTELERAREDLDRIEKAVQTGSVSRQELTRAQAAYDTAQAQVLGSQAALDMAELNRSYTEIRSPITGRIGRRLVDVGNLVGIMDRTVLTTVRQVEPIYVFFYISEYLLEGDLLERLQGLNDNTPMPFNVGLPNQEGHPYEGVIDFLDNTVDSRTGTVYIRGVLPNEAQTLLPGMFVRVSLPIRERPDAVLIPEKAVHTDLSGRYLLIVGEDNILQRRNIKLGTSYGPLRLVTEGLDGSETFIVGGFHMAQPGMPIQPIREGEIPPDMAGQMPGAPPTPEAMEQAN